MTRVERNAAWCLNCDTVIESKSVHDFQSCYCLDEQDGIFVDGGHDYQRFGWGRRANFKIWRAGGWGDMDD